MVALAKSVMKRANHLRILKKNESWRCMGEPTLLTLIANAWILTVSIAVKTHGHYGHMKNNEQ